LEPVIAVVPADLPLLDEPAGVTYVQNPQQELGMSHSLRLGFAALPPDVEAALILLGDQPTVEATLISRLVSARGATPFVATSAGGVLQPPVLVERSHFAIVEEAVGDIGLRELLRTHVELVRPVDVGQPNPDIDTLADLARLQAGRA
jgi:CTP:molybdopterin cytidylyltransferase MocA